MRAKPAEDLGYERDDFLAARESVRVVARPLRHEAQAGVLFEGAVGRQSARGGAVNHDAVGKCMCRRYTRWGFIADDRLIAL